MPLLGAVSCRPSGSPEASVGVNDIVAFTHAGYCVRERYSSLFVLDYASSRVWSIAICAASCLVSDVSFLRLFVFLCDSYNTYTLVVRWMKQNKDAVWSRVLRLVTGVRADPKYSYSYDIICT